jgi:2,4-dienoyl-CoA reductase-like NADH-dependent reductase (Old Yellow Enzyme family)
MMEATAISSIGRISPDDCGIWSDHAIPHYKKIADFIKNQNSVAAIQIAHAGRKASTEAPWVGNRPVLETKGGWTPVAPSPIPFKKDWPTPKELSQQGLKSVLQEFEEATRRCLQAGFQVVEIHMAHGYLLHEFLSPVSNQRKDEFGGSLENRMRFPLQVADAVRKVWPSSLPVFVRISATDWLDEGWDLSQSVQFCSKLKEAGIDLIDCSSGGISADAKIPVKPHYQVPFSETIRKEIGINTAAVGLISDPHQAEEILSQGKADSIFLARQFLRDPYWPLHAAKLLGESISWPKQYGRAQD